jgi:hypothetical protein
MKCPKNTLPNSEKPQIKYKVEGFEMWNTFPFWNLSKFEMYFELKIREDSMCWIHIEFIQNTRDLRTLRNFSKGF